ncbi:DUF3800 domain-containing protein [Streptomyces sp. NRRL S-350]|uniref:DUF3800 domain-containing protein n=1 Tax=Streptomyces sp. NRRL S-350 TaxID=1463902 RepID=UPI00131B7D08|nr:DUF3800 domain-containing protein [Streptomyces sp. NRRL S-350]
MPLPQNTFDHPSLTADTNAARWVACDESGWDGEQLLNGKRHMVYASVAIDDANASPIVEDLRRSVGATQAPELKFGSFKNRPHRLKALRDLWGPGGALDGRCSVYVVDKEYCVVAKVIDLLLEEEANSAGTDLYANGQAQHMARTLATQGRRALREAGFARLLKAFVALASARGRKDPEAAVELLYQELETAWAASTRRNVTDILFQLRSTRLHAAKFHEDHVPFGMLEMLVPALGQVARHWASLLGPIHVLADEQRSFTDQVLEYLGPQLRRTWGATPSSIVPGRPVRSIVRGVSTAHPSIQLADLLAGAAVAAVGNGLGHQHSDAGDYLWPSISPLVDPYALLP